VSWLKIILIKKFLHNTCVSITVAWSVLRLRMEEWPPIAANILH